MHRFILLFNSAVYCQEDKCGQLLKIIFNPETWEVTDLVVEKGLLLKKARIFPISVVESAAEDEVKIAVAEQELENYSEYKEAYIEIPSEGRKLESAAVRGTPLGVETGEPPIPKVKQLYIEGVADHLAPMSTDTPVEAADKTVGKVYGLIIDPKSKRITEIMVHKGTIFEEDFLLSNTTIARISRKGVFLDLTADELNDLIEFDEEQDHYWDRTPVSD